MVINRGVPRLTSFPCKAIRQSPGIIEAEWSQGRECRKLRLLVHRQMSAVTQGAERAEDVLRGQGGGRFRTQAGEISRQLVPGADCATAAQGRNVIP